MLVQTHKLWLQPSVDIR